MLEILLALVMGLAALDLGATLPTARPPRPRHRAPEPARSISVRELLERIAKEQQHVAA